MKDYRHLHYTFFLLKCLNLFGQIVGQRIIGQKTTCLDKGLLFLGPVVREIISASNLPKQKMCRRFVNICTSDICTFET